MLGTFDCGTAGFHGALYSPDLEVRPGLLHLALPVTLGLSGNADDV
jgi:hypothetical protein